ncbi:hypothetical protein V2G26_018257 [Clonostachys chloroleuca]
MAAFGDLFVRFFRAGRLPQFEWRLKAFVTGITISVLFILARCAFRVYELKEGHSGAAITHEVPFIIMEGVFMIVGTIALFIGHPGLALKPGQSASESTQFTIKASSSDTEHSAYPRAKA